MSFPKRSENSLELVVDGKTYEVLVREIPFREGVELSCMVDDQQIRVSDRGLGDHEALRLLEEEIRTYLRTLS